MRRKKAIAPVYAIGEQSFLRKDEVGADKEFVEQPTLLKNQQQQPSSVYFDVESDGIVSENSQSPIFEGSLLDIQTFCAEFISIAQTFELPDRACNDLLGLVKRMAPVGSKNLCPADFDDASLRLFNSQLPSPDSGAAVILPPLPSDCFPPSKVIYTTPLGVEELLINEQSQTQHLKRRRGRPPGSAKAAKYMAMAAVYEKEQQKRYLEAEKFDERQLMQNRMTATEIDLKKTKYDPDRGKQQQLDHNVEVAGWTDEHNRTIMDDECAVVEDNYSYGQIQSREHFVGNDVMAKVLGSIDQLSSDVNSLRRQYAHQTFGQQPYVEEDKALTSLTRLNKSFEDNANKPTKIRQLRQDFDWRRPKYFVKIFDENDRVVPICDMNRDDMINTVRISRENEETRIMYSQYDITERVLNKLDISLYLHNPSYCGRATADALFNPEFLSRFHILSEGQIVSRSHRENLSPELTKVFYDTLRKLGASRITPEYQFGWMEQARDAVNQRNRDIKIPGCRRKFFQNSDPIFE